MTIRLKAMKTARFCFLMLFIFLCKPAGFTQSPIIIPKAASIPKLDGILDDAAWQGIEPFKMISLNPAAGLPPFQETEVRIIYTDRDLYVGAWLFDKEPDKIRATSKIRDDMGLTNDWFGISLDTYLDKENGMMFATNPAGLRTDMELLNDGQGSWPVNEKWNTVWTVMTTKDNKGWYAEMQIPLSSLRYQKTGNKVNMGLLLWRYIGRKQEWDVFPPISNEWGLWSFAKVSQFQLIEFDGIESVNPLFFSPYLLGGIQQNSRLNEAGDAYTTEKTWARNAGLDVKYGLSKNLTLDLTLNTDFAQVESDDQQVNLTRFSLFYPERRQFFLERSSIFDVNFLGNGQLFYSRRIGLYNGGAVPVWGGGRLTGRVGNWDIGVMSIQTGFLKDEETGEEILPTLNNSVLRLRRKVGINSNSYIGGMSTLKLDPSGNYNWNYAFDAIINTYKNDYLNVIWAQTLDSDDTSNPMSLKTANIMVDYRRRAQDGWSYDLAYARSGERFNPELGFQYRQNYTDITASGGYGWDLADKPGHINKQTVNLMADAYFRNDDGQLETLTISPSYGVIIKSLHEFYVTGNIISENLRDTFYLSGDVYVPAGNFRFANATLQYVTPTWKFLTGSARLVAGQYYDGGIGSLTLSPALRLASSWIINFTYQYNRISFPLRDQNFNAHVARLKVTYMLNTQWSAYSYIQYNNLIDGIVWNAKLRYNPREGVDLYVVYNDFINTRRQDSEPPLPFSLQRTLLLKFTYTFRVR
jgi:hypothetical protein